MPVVGKSIMAELPEPEELDMASLAAAYSAGDIDLFVVLGPTASGKTRFAVNLARQLSSLCGVSPSRVSTPGDCATLGIMRGGTVAAGDGGAERSEASVGVLTLDGNGAESCGAEIISADSRQVYRGMDIGTGKDLDEYGEVPYHLIDILPAGGHYNVYEFQNGFAEAYAGIRSRGRIPILCGGTGLYINSVVSGYDFRNVKPLSEAAQGVPSQTPAGPMPQKPFIIGTLVSREVRNARIDARLDARLKEGMVDEIRGLLDGGVPAQTLISYGLEYKFVTRYVLGEIAYDEMRDGLATAIHQFAKRQMTWFRGMERSGVRIHWVNP